jgi:hypothetical protein
MQTNLVTQRPDVAQVHQQLAPSFRSNKLHHVEIHIDVPQAAQVNADISINDGQSAASKSDVPASIE